MQLTRNRIIGTTIKLIERDGVAALSVLGVASELGCGVVPLYDRVTSKAALLDRVAAAVMSEVEITARRGQQPGWTDRVRARAKALRNVGRAYPRCTVLAASRPLASGPQQAPGESWLRALSEAGSDGADSARIARAVLAYVLGSVLRDALTAPGPAAEREDEDFEFGLDLLLRAAAELLPAQAS